MEGVAHLGALLKQLRDKAGMSQREVIEAMGVSRATAYLWETEGSAPFPKTLEELLILYKADDEERATAWRLRASR